MTQGLAQKLSVPISTDREYKPGVLVAEETVKCFDKHWYILIESGASCNYARRRFIAEGQQYAEVLNAHEGDSITVFLVTGSRVNVPKVPLN